MKEAGAVWYANWKRRLLAEVRVMGERFPGLQLERASDGTLAWVGALEPVAGQPCVVSITYPQTYPYAEPRIDILAPALTPGAPHRYPNGSICVHQTRWDPSRGTAASVVPLVAGWWVAYMHWLATGEGL